MFGNAGAIQDSGHCFIWITFISSGHYTCGRLNLSGHVCRRLLRTTFRSLQHSAGEKPREGRPLPKRWSCANTYFTAKTFNNDLGEHVEPDSVILLAELGNLTVVSRFPLAEVVR